MEVMSRMCFHTENERVKQFSCSLQQTCCGAECCISDLRFYTHWYFWLAVAVLIMFLVAAIISGYCKHSQSQPPYRILWMMSGHGPTEIMSWIWGMDQDSSLSSPQEFQHSNVPRSFFFPSGLHGIHLHDAVINTPDTACVT